MVRPSRPTVGARRHISTVYVSSDATRSCRPRGVPPPAVLSGGGTVSGVVAARSSIWRRAGQWGGAARSSIWRRDCQWGGAARGDRGDEFRSARSDGQVSAHTGTQRSDNPPAMATADSTVEIISQYLTSRFTYSPSRIYMYLDSPNVP